MYNLTMLSEIINTWQFNVLGYLLFIVVFFQCYKLAVKDAKRDGAATILLQLIAGLSILIAFPFFEFKIPTDPKVYAFLFGALIFYALNDRLQTTVRKHLPVSTFSILSQLTTVFLILIGLTVFKEPFVLNKIIGAFIILMANVLLIYKKGMFKVNPYIGLSVLASLFFSIAISIDIGISKQFNLPFYIMVTLIVPAIMILLVEKIPAQAVLEEHRSASKRYYWFAGVSWGLAILCSLRSFQFGEVTTIVPLQAAAVLLNVLVAYFFLHEKEDRFKKFIAACLVFVGVYLTVLG